MEAAANPPQRGLRVGRSVPLGKIRCYIFLDGGYESTPLDEKITFGICGLALPAWGRRRGLVIEV
jgi:hypothetical protein